MNSYFKFGTLLVLISSLFNSCQTDEYTDSYMEFDITPYDILKIKQLGYDPQDLTLIGLKNKHKNSEKYYIIDGEDVMLSYDLVEEMFESKRIAKQKELKSKKYYAYAVKTNNAIDLNRITQVAGSINSEEHMIVNELANID